MDEEIVNDIIMNIVNPILMQHNGFVILAGIEEDIVPKVILEFHGGCQGCPLSHSSTLGLITEILKSELGLNELIVENGNSYE